MGAGNPGRILEYRGKLLADPQWSRWLGPLQLQLIMGQMDLEYYDYWLRYEFSPLTRAIVEKWNQGGDLN